MNNDIGSIIPPLLNLNDEEIVWRFNSWDKSDCSDIGLVKILLIQLLRDHIKENGDYADQDFVELLHKITN